MEESSGREVKKVNFHVFKVHGDWTEEQLSLDNKCLSDRLFFLLFFYMFL